MTGEQLPDLIGQLLNLMVLRVPCVAIIGEVLTGDNDGPLVEFMSQHMSWAGCAFSQFYRWQWNESESTEKVGDDTPLVLVNCSHLVYDFFCYFFGLVHLCFEARYGFLVGNGSMQQACWQERWMLVAYSHKGRQLIKLWGIGEEWQERAGCRHWGDGEREPLLSIYQVQQ